LTAHASGALAPLPWSLGPYRTAVERRLALWKEEGLGPRYWRKDPTVWPAAPPSDVRDRMGWLSLPETPPDRLADLERFADEVRAEGTRHVVVLGMGGSSLAPDVFARTFEVRSDYPELFVLDSTHPSEVTALTLRIDLARTLFIVSSKSGTTTEPNAFFHYFFHQVQRLAESPGRQFVAVTDPGTPLERLAHDREFRRAFLVPPDVGGRYSALTEFGLVPAALHGVPVRALLDAARGQAAAQGPAVPVVQNPGFVLGAALGELGLAGRDKVTFLADPPFDSFPDWAEQLIAESTGKSGRGIVPVAHEPSRPPNSYGTDRVFVTLERPGTADGAESRGKELARAGHPVLRFALENRASLGAEFLRWETGVAMAGAVIGINPYDQPDVELAKQLARDAMADPKGPGSPPEDRTVRADAPDSLRAALERWAGTLAAGDYVAVQAYLPPSITVREAVETLQRSLLERYGRATTLGFGPRFLHSTGQLHKGGPPGGHFLQLTNEIMNDVAVPEESYSFGRLIAAQALGDLLALVQRGRSVLRVELGRDLLGGLAALARSIHG